MAQLKSTADYRKHMFKLISGGVPQILWEQIADLRTGKSDIGETYSISSACADSLVNVSIGLDGVYEWAYRMVDSSGKTPSGFFESTITAVGDYNECLDVHTPDLDGQYCMADLFPLKTHAQHATWPGPSREERAATGKVNLGDIPYAKGMSFNFALCVPSKCQAEEVRNVLNVLLEPYLLRPLGAISCDTKDSISYGTRLSNFTTHQLVSLLIITSIVAMVLIGTTYQFALKVWTYQQTGNFTAKTPSFISAISIADNTQQLFKPSDRGNRNFVLDVFKLIVILAGVVLHTVVCVEIPISYYAYERLTFFNYLIGAGQALINESGLNIMVFLGGVASYSMLVPMAKNKKLPFFSAIFDRWVRFVPSMACITALEFIYPLIISGPLFSRVADFTLKKCTQTWWTNLVFINNWFPVIDICAGHTFSSSIDFQLFVLGLIATYITIKSVKAGIVFSATMMIYGWLHIGYNAYAYKTTSTLYIPDPRPVDVINYLNYIHMNTAVYIPSYFMGFIAGHMLASGYRFKLDSIKDHIKWNILSMIPLAIVFLQNYMYNGLQVIPQSWAPMQISTNRIFMTLGGAMLFVYYCSINSFAGMKLQKYESQIQEKSTSNFEFITGLCRLSYAIYLANYLLIKMEFFGQKVLYPSDFYLSVKRVATTAILVIMFAFVFQLFFIAPFNNLRRIAFDRKRIVENNNINNNRSHKTKSKVN
ncbi:hypothetical protein HDE_02215 [Halotydeus destructor]|nr:hypothetical protein HDE_02215 [Halotydeus destructor]